MLIRTFSCICVVCESEGLRILINQKASKRKNYIVYLFNCHNSSLIQFASVRQLYYNHCEPEKGKITDII